MEGFSAHDWTRQDRAYERGLTDQAPPLTPDETVLEPRSEKAPGACPSPDAFSDRAPARFAQAAGRTPSCPPHPGRGGPLRGDRGTAPAPGENTP